MRWNLSSIVVATVSALLFMLVSANDANAQSGWGSYFSPFSQSQQTPSLVAPSYSIGSSLSAIQNGYGASRVGVGVPSALGFGGNPRGTAIQSLGNHGYPQASPNISNTYSPANGSNIVCQAGI